MENNRRNVNQNSMGLLLLLLLLYNATRWQHKPRRGREENLEGLLFSVLTVSEGVPNLEDVPVLY